ncbi:MAG TPA: zinc-dependent metalloprotease, partial [Puia sp.]|nr:zinc-dependent metalloprotease [Puia sp.]
GGVSAQRLPFGDKEEPKGDRIDSLLMLLKGKKSRIRPYEKVITADAKAFRGPFTIYSVRDSFFIEVPDSMLNARLLMVKRIVKGSLGSIETKLPGEDLESKNIYFEIGPDSSLFIRNDQEPAQAAANSRLGKAVRDANTDRVLQSLNIIALGPGHSWVADATALLKGNSAFTSAADFRAPSRNYHVDYIHSYPLNIELGLFRVIGSDDGQPVVINTSIVMLPREPMQQRLFDRRVGYFADKVNYFSDEQRHVEEREFILRWRLEPRPEDLERWKKGELVEPAKPIVIYIDPNTPKQWVKYLIMGVNDWQKAFEQAGFKNAIMGREWPEGDSANLDDVRYSFIRYLPSAQANAYGPPNVHDLRSGEIIQTHIGWFHNVQTLVHDWYMIQAGAVDPKARHMNFDEELMGQLIRFVSSHEVGHTLGLRHNFGSSGVTPVEKMRDAAWLKVHGHTASIMDYARFNYVAQPEDNIPESELWPHIGEYDRWAIEWGYKYSGGLTAEADAKITGHWATERLAANPRLWFGSMEGEGKSPTWTTDPRAQMEDLGDNNMIANAYGIKNLKRIVPNLVEWCHEPAGRYQNLNTAYTALKEQFRRYMSQVLVNVGGVERTYKTEDDGTDIYAPVAKAKQLQALAFLNEQLFNTPLWIMPQAITNKIVSPNDPDFVGDLQVRAINSLLDSITFMKLNGNIGQFGVTKSLSLQEYLGT